MITACGIGKVHSTLHPFGFITKLFWKLNFEYSTNGWSIDSHIKKSGLDIISHNSLWILPPKVMFNWVNLLNINNMLLNYKNRTILLLRKAHLCSSCVRSRKLWWTFYYVTFLFTKRGAWLSHSPSPIDNKITGNTISSAPIYRRNTVLFWKFQWNACASVSKKKCSLNVEQKFLVW